MKNYVKKLLQLATITISAVFLTLNFSAQTTAAPTPTLPWEEEPWEEEEDTGWKFDKETKTLIIQKNIYIYYSEAGFKFSDSCPWDPYYEDIENVIIDNKVKFLPMAIFSNLTNLKKIKIPSSVTKIQEYAFYNCTSLETIEIPDSVTSIGFEAFFDCKNLKRITIGRNVKSIGKNAFGGCSSLKTIQLSPDNLYFTIKNGMLFSKNLANLLLVPKKTNKTVTIPKTVQIIDSFAFADCKALTKIVIPSNVKEISEGAFYNCVNLKTIQFAKKSKCKKIVDFIKHHGDDYDEIYGAFENCRSLISLTFPDSLEEIDYYTLNNCVSLKQVSFGSKFVSGNGCFEYKGLSKLTTIKVSSKNKVYSTSNGILFNKSKTELLWYPENKSNKEYTVPVNVKVIGSTAFQYNKNLSSLNLSSVETIYSEAFSDCTNLKTVKWSKKLKLIRESSFYNCKKLKSFVSYGNMLKIEFAAFYNCSSLDRITLKSGINYIGNCSFYGCSFKKVTIPASVKELSSQSFGYYNAGGTIKKIKNFTIYCKKNSAAHKYAKEEKFKYKYY